MTKIRMVEQQQRRKRYISKLKPEKVGIVLRMKLHMTNLLVNFTNKGEERRCRLCNKEDMTEEHLKSREVKYMWKHNEPE